MLAIFMWCIHVLYQTKWRRNTDYIHVVWDERLENLFSGGMFVPDKN